MEFKDVVYGRRSVRHYTDEKISDEDLAEILDAAMWAPSGANIQPWYFVVAKSDEALRKLDKLMKITAENNMSHLEERFASHPRVVKEALHFISKLGNAPVVVMVFRDKKDYSWALSEEGVVQSISAAIQNLLLSAYDHGIASCWLTAPDQADMNDVFRDEFAPDHGELVALVTLGYAEEGKVFKAPKRKENKFTII